MRIPRKHLGLKIETPETKSKTASRNRKLFLQKRNQTTGSFTPRELKIWIRKSLAVFESRILEQRNPGRSGQGTREIKILKEAD